jgi:lysyl-tRNA synthetase, class II
VANVTTPDDMGEQMRVRLDKIPAIREQGQHPYAERFERTHSLAEAAELEDGVAGVRVAGRMTAVRTFGKLTFARLLDIGGSIQIALQRDILGEQYKAFGKLVDVGDFVGVEGEVFTTRTGEKTVNARSWTFLSKALRPLPEKWHGLADPELRLRRRYLDLISTPEVRERFLKRTRIIRTIREYLDSHGFLEIDTPVLTNKASGAMARPFITHNNALDIDVYLRIAPETYLKRAIAGGFDRVYEFARSFRNEGVDA